MPDSLIRPGTAHGRTAQIEHAAPPAVMSAEGARAVFSELETQDEAAKVLVIDDDRAVRHMIHEAFAGTDIEVVAASSGVEGLRLLPEHAPDLVLLDVLLAGTGGLEVFQQIRALDPKLPVIFITATDSSNTAIEAMKLGAFDYLHKPLDIGKVQTLVRQGLRIRRFMRVPVTVESGDTTAKGEQLVGRSPAMQEVYKAIGRVAPPNVTVLIEGESGTGKELVARAIYHHSSRADGPFMAVNCAAIPDTLLESELFGHEKGSFTGADRQRVGKFEQCSGGTLFLDEIGDMSPLVQSKVLRLLQEQRFQRVGGNETIQTDVRIIAATNWNLERAVGEGKYRADLYYRLNGFTIHLPPLRERGDDIILLLDFFLSRYNRELEKDVHGFSTEALELLTHYSWPGNVRELQSLVRQALLQTTGPLILPDFLPEKIRAWHKDNSQAERDPFRGSDLREFIDKQLRGDPNNLYAESVEMMERYLLTRVLRQTNGNQSQTAKMLGISRGSLRKKMRTLRISVGRNVAGDDAIEEDETVDAM